MSASEKAEFGLVIAGLAVWVLALTLCLARIERRVKRLETFKKDLTEYWSGERQES